MGQKQVGGLVATLAAGPREPQVRPDGAVAGLVEAPDVGAGPAADAPDRAVEPEDETVLGKPGQDTPI